MPCSLLPLEKLLGVDGVGVELEGFLVGGVVVNNHADGLCHFHGMIALEDVVDYFDSVKKGGEKL